MSIFIPKEGEIFNAIDIYGKIVKLINNPLNQHLIKSGNCYRTEEDAERARGRDYALRELQVLLNADSKEDAYCMILGKHLGFINDALEKLGESKLRLILGLTPPVKEN